MSRSRTYRLVVVWLLLVMVTLASWSLDAGFVGRWTGLAVLLLAFIKARIVLFDFMDLARAPKTIQLLGNAWTAAACAVLAGIYWFHI